jgi:2-oxoglutarate/2-oxoacid ferredoxin oxidoreductase subunit alpha
VNNMNRLARKFETARKFVPPPVKEVSGVSRSKIGIIAYGTTHWALTESCDQLLAEHNITADYLRLRAYPFNQDVHDFIKNHDRVYVVEQNRDAQMFQLIKLDIAADQVTRLRSVVHYNGLPIDARSVTDAIVSQEASSQEAK